MQDLFAKICKRHNYESFDTPGGETGTATFSAEGIRELRIERDRLSIEEDVTVAFDLLKRNFTDQVKVVQEELKIPGFFEPRIKLRALWPLPEGGSALEALRDRALKLNPDHYSLLGAVSVESVGIVIQADLEELSHMYFEFSPYVRDPSQLHMDVESYRHQTLETPEVIEALMQEVYDYFNSKVVAFVQTFMP